MNDLFAAAEPTPDQPWVKSVDERGALVLHRLAEKYGADYAIVNKVPRSLFQLSIKPVYENKSYAVYHFTPETQHAASPE
jgi:hypothetical protein